MQVKLIVVGGKVNKSTVVLGLPAVIGRSRDVQLTISHPMVSRRHCELFEDHGLMMVRDLGSLNGTTVGGQRIAEAPLPPDAEFIVGPLTFRADYECSRDPGTLPPVKPAATKPRPPDSGTEDGPAGFESPGRTPNMFAADDQNRDDRQGKAADDADLDEFLKGMP